MKKFFAIALVLIVFSAVLIPLGGAVYAESEADYAVPEGYLAEIAFYDHNLSGGGVARSIVVTFDRQYFYQDEYFVPFIFAMSTIGEILDQIGYKSEQIAGCRVKGTRQYDSVTNVYIENEIDGYENSPSEAEEKRSLFFIDYISRQKTIFENVQENENSVFYHLLNVLYSIGLEKDDILLTYSYGTPYKIIISDADKTIYDSSQKIYIHDFYMSVDGSGRTIVVTQHVPNSVVWYAAALGGSVVIGLFFALIYLAKRKR